MENLSTIYIAILIVIIFIMIIMIIRQDRKVSYYKELNNSQAVAYRIKKETRLEIIRDLEEQLKQKKEYIDTLELEALERVHKKDINLNNLIFYYKEEVAKYVICRPVIKGDKVIRTEATIRKRVEGKFKNIPVTLKFIDKNLG